MGRHANRRRGFTLIELLVVMSIVALLASIAAPRFFRSLDRAKEVTLQSSLATMRDAIDQYAADKGRYPDSLADLVASQYLRALPLDPLLGRRDAWVEVPPPSSSALKGKLYDVKTPATGAASDGTTYASW